MCFVHNCWVRSGLIHSYDMWLTSSCNSSLGSSCSLLGILSVTWLCLQDGIQARLGMAAAHLLLPGCPFHQSPLHLSATHLVSGHCLSASSLQVVYTRGALLWQQLTSPGQLKPAGRLSFKSKRKVHCCIHISYACAVNRVLNAWGCTAVWWC